VRILLWHVHGSWTTSFVQGRHEYIVPVTEPRGPDGLGRARTWQWPSSVREVPPDDLRAEHLDAVVLQRPHELALTTEWSGRRPGDDLSAVFLEHNTPSGPAVTTRHPLADRRDIPIVHVTHFNALAWDCGSASTRVIEHGVIDPGYRFTGDQARAAVVVNDPVRRGRVVGTDLLAAITERVGVDVFGMQVNVLASEDQRLRAFEDLPQDRLHAELPRRRVYVHTTRWTSLGLSLLEAMHLGLPVVALASTEAPWALRDGAGFATTDVDALLRAVSQLVHDPELARERGRRARQLARARYGLDRFLEDWDILLDELSTGAPQPVVAARDGQWSR
jgi:glycosyltransferase involved in cell wall biosynthesis